MAAKFVVLAALVALAHSSVVPVARVDADYNSFAYDVADPNTGDYKSQVETRVGGNVVGQYSLLDSDGTKRTVDYTADDINGFNAVVRKDAAVITAPVVAASAVVAASPAVVDARTIAAPALVSAAPSVIAARTYATPTVYAASAPVITARTFSSPVVYSAPNVIAGHGVVANSGLVATRTIGGPVFARTYAPGYYGSPLTYASYSSPISYW